MFRDRQDAGKQLALALEKYRGEDVLVLAIPRGGVEVGYHVARYLEADFSLIVIRKLPFPHQPESGFGAVAEDGSVVILEDAARWVPQEAVTQIVQEQQAELERRIEVLRQGRPLPEIAGRTVILVDDGIAMGSTMRASVALCRSEGAGKVVVAVPVAGPQRAQEFEQIADEIVVLETPPYFRAVAQVYQYWYDVSDQEVLATMRRWEQEA